MDEPARFAPEPVEVPAGAREAKDAPAPARVAGGDAAPRPSTRGAQMLRGCWYVAMVGRHLRRGRMVGRVFLNEPVLIGRDREGRVFAIRDACAHRGVPLHHGSFDGSAVQCRYHGWRFGTDGRCVEIPALVADHRINLAKIRCQQYPCVEQQGMVWLYFGEPDHPFDVEPGRPPLMPDFPADAAPRADMWLTYHWSIDDASFSIMDPAHIAFVHRAWWLGKSKRLLAAKEKRFEPCEFGWRSDTHRPPRKSLIHRLFGAEVSTDIANRLPGLRIERIMGRRHRLVNLLVVTPIDDDNTQMIQCFWWTMRTLDFLGPVIGRIAFRFLRQDDAISLMQREGLRYNPSLILIPDADTQMGWWLRLKAEWTAHRRERRPFANPLKPATLRYRS
jgi:phenylpropionate dioxygenase-like ring-hydroxylating dioxygenase large terminal subunit